MSRIAECSTIVAAEVGPKSLASIARSRVLLYCAPIEDLNCNVYVRNFLGSVEKTRPASAA
eukprot:474656-Prymnesium_polylepis.1